MSAQLEKRGVAALSDYTLSASALAELIAEAEAGITAAETAAETAAKQFLDPVASPDINKARAAMDATQFVADRLLALLPRLQDKYRAVQAEEDRAQWRARFEALERERNQLAAEFGKVYPAAVSQLVDLINRIAANDAALSQLHGTRPSGAKGYLLNAELTARGLDAFTRDTPSLTRNLQLPDWSQSNKLVWPPPTTPAGVMVANSVAATHDPRRYSSTWREALREETDRRVADEQKRVEQEAARVAEDKAAYERSLPR